MRDEIVTANMNDDVLVSVCLCVYHLLMCRFWIYIEIVWSTGMHRTIWDNRTTTTTQQRSEGRRSSNTTNINNNKIQTNAIGFMWDDVLLVYKIIAFFFVLVEFFLNITTLCGFAWIQMSIEVFKSIDLFEREEKLFVIIVSHGSQSVII